MEGFNLCGPAGDLESFPEDANCLEMGNSDEEKLKDDAEHNGAAMGDRSNRSAGLQGVEAELTYTPEVLNESNCDVFEAADNAFKRRVLKKWRFGRRGSNTANASGEEREEGAGCSGSEDPRDDTIRQNLAECSVNVTNEGSDCGSDGGGGGSEVVMDRKHKYNEDSSSASSDSDVKVVDLFRRRGMRVDGIKATQGEDEGHVVGSDGGFSDVGSTNRKRSRKERKRRDSTHKGKRNNFSSVGMDGVCSDYSAEIYGENEAVTFEEKSSDEEFDEFDVEGLCSGDRSSGSSSKMENYEDEYDEDDFIVDDDMTEAKHGRRNEKLKARRGVRRSMQQQVLQETKSVESESRRSIADLRSTELEDEAERNISVEGSIESSFEVNKKPARAGRRSRGMELVDKDIDITKECTAGAIRKRTTKTTAFGDMDAATRHINSVYCALCGSKGMILCCDFCSLSFHLECLARDPHLVVFIPVLDCQDIAIETPEGKESISGRRRRLATRRMKRKNKNKPGDEYTDKLANCTSGQDVMSMKSEVANIGVDAVSQDIATSKNPPLVQEEIKHAVPDNLDSPIVSNSCGGNVIPPSTGDSAVDTKGEAEVDNNDSTPLSSTASSNSKEEKWKCPKCCHVIFAECRPHHKSYKRTRFKYQHWLDTTEVRNLEIPDKTNTKEMINLSDKYKKKDLFLRDLELFDLRYCMTLFAQDAVLRGVDFLFDMCEAAENSKNENERFWFVDYGCEVAWLLTNLLDFCDSTTSTVRETCTRAAGVILEKWYTRFYRQINSRGSELHTDPANVLCLLEGIEAERALDESGTRWKVSRDKVRDTMDITECVKFEPSKILGVENVCPNCNSRISKFPMCATCNFRLCVPHYCIHYRKLTDALVWGNLFNRLSLDLPYSVADVLKVVRKCRPWRNSVELGIEDFRLQLYLLTHVVFILTRWGRYRLDPAMFQEEYFFLRVKLGEAIALDDPELVGELVQSLRLFWGPDFRTAEGRWTRDVIDLGIAYLLEKERRHGTCGRWIARNEGLYDKMHATYCAMLGLSLPRRNDQIPQPDEMHLAWWRIFAETKDTTFPLQVASDAPALTSNPMAYFYRDNKILVQRLSSVSASRKTSSNNIENEDANSELLVLPHDSKISQFGVGLPSNTKRKLHFDRDTVICRMYRYGNEFCLLAKDVQSALHASRSIWELLMSLITKHKLETFLLKKEIRNNDEVNYKNGTDLILNQNCKSEQVESKIGNSGESIGVCPPQGWKCSGLFGGEKGILITRASFEVLIEILEMAYLHEAIGLDVSVLKSILRNSWNANAPPPPLPSHVSRLFPDIANWKEHQKSPHGSSKFQQGQSGKAGRRPGRPRGSNKTGTANLLDVVKGCTRKKGESLQGADGSLMSSKSINVGVRLFSKKRGLPGNLGGRTGEIDTLKQTLDDLEVFCKTFSC